MNKISIFLDEKITSQDETFKFIANICVEEKVIKKSDTVALIEAFKKRERESSTGFENGFAIPHALTSVIIQPKIIYLRTEDGIDWDSLDQKPTKYIIALLIPEKDRSSDHIDVLSKVATGLMNNNFTNIISESKNEEVVEKAFFDLLEKEKEIQPNFNESSTAKNKNILAITACPVGVAHTYLAAEKLIEGAEKLNFNIKVETHGSVGIKNNFTKKEIEDADIILVASDIGIDLSRFKGKRIYHSSVKLAIKQPDLEIEKALANAKVNDELLQTNQTSEKEEKKSYIVKHLLSGVSYMIPFIIFGGIFIALSLGIGKAIYAEGKIPDYSFLYYLLKMGEVGFLLMIPILAGFIANSVAGRSAIAPAMIVALIANSSNLIFKIPGIPLTDSDVTPLGFIGAILFGLLIGHTVKWMNGWAIHRNLISLMPIFVIPLGVTLFYGLLSIFVIAPPIAFVMTKFGDAMKTLFADSEHSNIGLRVGIGIGMGFVIGAMAGFDMGGPINKIAFVTCSALVTMNIYNPMGMMAAAIPVAPIGCGIASQIYRNHFNEQQRGMGVSAIIMGLIGISEGAIPFAIADPKRVFITNVVSSAIAGAVAGALGVTNSVAHGGPIVGILGAVSGNFIGSGSAQLGLGITFFFLAIIIGVVVNVLLYGVLIKYIKDTSTTKVKQKTKRSFSLSQITYFNKTSQFIKQNSKMVAFSIISFLTGACLITGLSLLGVSIANNNFGTLTSIEANYCLYFLATGLILALFTMFYSFTVFKKQKTALT